MATEAEDEGWLQRQRMKDGYRGRDAGLKLACR